MEKIPIASFVKSPIKRNRLIEEKCTIELSSQKIEEAIELLVTIPQHLQIRVDKVLKLLGMNNRLGISVNLAPK